MRTRTLPFCSLALALAALAAAFLPGWPEALQFDRARIAGGDWWRLVTGHWTHWTPDHLRWDLVVFAVFGAVLERQSRGRFVAVVAGASLAISAGVWFGAADLGYYRGLSGLDSALYAAVFVSLLRSLLAERRFGAAIVPALAVAGFGVKIAFEVASGDALFVDPAATFRVVPLAHGLGAFVGVAAGAIPSRPRPAARSAPGVPAPAGP